VPTRLQTKSAGICFAFNLTIERHGIQSHRVCETAALGCCNIQSLCFHERGYRDNSDQTGGGAFTRSGEP